MAKASNNLQQESANQEDTNVQESRTKQVWSRVSSAFKWLKFRKRTKVKLARIEEQLSLFTSILLRIGLLILIIGVSFLLYKELSNDSYVLKAFQVPRSFELDGYNGVVMANKVLDEVIDIQEQGSTLKETKAYSKKAEQTTQDLQIMGVGFSINSLAYHIRHAFGIDQAQIYGELVKQDSVLSLTLRMTNTAPVAFKQSFKHMPQHQAIDSLTYKAAEKIMELTEPYQLALYFDRQDQKDKALNIIKKVITSESEEKEWAYNLWGIILRNAPYRNYNEAGKRFEQAVKINPNYSLAYTNWGAMVYDTGNVEKAIELLEISIALEDDRPLGFYLLAKAYINLNEFEKGERYAKKALELAPTDVYYHRQLADLYYRTGNVAKELAQYEQLLELNPTDPSSLQGYANAFYAQKDYAQALKYYKLGLEMNPENVELLANYIIVLLGDGQNKKALNLSERMISEYANLPFPHYFTAFVYTRLKNETKAQYHLDFSKKLAPKEGANYVVQAAIEDLRGDTEQFYANLDSAFNIGFYQTGILEEAPFDKYKEEKRFLDLLKKYNMKIYRF